MDVRTRRLRYWRARLNLAWLQIENDNLALFDAAETLRLIEEMG